jgi:hypothetical protein
MLWLAMLFGVVIGVSLTTLYAARALDRQRAHYERQDAALLDTVWPRRDLR